MKWDEFAFVNHQLAAMLRDGIPLEGALRQLSSSMHRGELRDEFERLRTDLEKGTPLNEALVARRLPALYVQMIQVGIKSNDLPSVLTLLADYYQRANTVWTRLKGLMVYPAIVLGASLALSVFLALLGGYVLRAGGIVFNDLLEGRSLPPLTLFMFRMGRFGLWGPVAVIALMALGALAMSTVPRLRLWLRWWFPGSREACLWQISAAMAMMLDKGCSLKEAIELIVRLEGDSPAGRDLREWQQRLVSGHSNFMDLARPRGYFPPLFIWLASSGGSDLAAGLKRAAEIYRARAEYRTELLLQAALPTSVLVLGAVIFVQVMTLAHFAVSQFLPLISVTGSLSG
jgi:type II secretory pathway component PulF